MKLEDLIADPLYQMNLCLWMLSSSGKAGVTPLFRDAGLQLRAIEPPLPLPLEIKSLLSDNDVRVSDPVEPDLILHDRQRGFVLLECKASMFGAEVTGSDSPHRQARALLVQVPEILADALALDRQQVLSSHLVYLSRDKAGISQTAGLKEIADSLVSREFRVVPFGMLGLRANEKSIVVAGGYSPGILPPSLASQIPDAGVKVQDLEPETDPRPLYFVPWMPGSESSRDSRGAEIFGNRVLQATAARIGQSRPAVDLEFHLDEILNEATWSCFERWRNKDAAKFLRKNAKKLIADTFRSAASSAELSGDLGSHTFRMKIPDIDSKEKLIEAFRKWEATPWNEPDLQGELFELPTTAQSQFATDGEASSEGSDSSK